MWETCPDMELFAWRFKVTRGCKQVSVAWIFAQSKKRYNDLLGAHVNDVAVYVVGTTDNPELVWLPTWPEGIDTDDKQKAYLETLWRLGV